MLMNGFPYFKKIHGRTFPQVRVRHIEATSMAEEVRPYLQVPAELDSIRQFYGHKISRNGGFHTV